MDGSEHSKLHRGTQIKYRVPVTTKSCSHFAKLVPLTKRLNSVSFVSRAMASRTLEREGLGSDENHDFMSFSAGYSDDTGCREKNGLS